MKELSPRQDQIARLYADGLTFKAIAARLGISPATVARHLDTIGLKLGSDPERSRREVIRRWVDQAA